MDVLQRVWNSFTNFFYPASKSCPICGQSLGHADLICRNCGQVLETWHKQNFCRICGRPKAAFRHCQCAYQKIYYQRLIAAAPYTGNFKKAIHALKYGGKTHLAPVLGKLMGKRALKAGITGEGLLLPIPLSPGKLSQRGFNQSLLLAKAVGKELGLPVLEDVLQKTKETAPQASLSRALRQQNLQGAFRVREQKTLLNQTVILIDDIFTTGATVNEAAQVLLTIGVAEVIVLVWALGISKKL